MSGAAWLLGGAAAVLYLLGAMVAGAGRSVGRHALDRLADGARPAFDLRAGSRAWLAVGLVRDGALVTAGVAIGIAAGVAAAAAGGLLLALAGRMAHQIGAIDGEATLRRAFPAILAIDRFFRPITVPMAWLSARLCARRREEPEPEDDRQREEQLEEYIRGAEEEGLLEREQSELFREIVDVGDLVVREVMTPRTEIDAVAADADLDELRRVLIASRHSRLPVYDGSLDNIVGVVALREVLPQLIESGAAMRVRELLHPVTKVPETKPVLELLRELQRKRQQMAIVVDEYGGTAGLVTLEDLVEEIVGEIQDEHEPAAEPLRRQRDGSWLIDGRTPIEEVERRLGVELPDEEVDTIGGLLFSRLGRVPRAGDRVRFSGGFVLEVARLEGRRVATVRLRGPRAAAGAEGR